MSATGSLEGRSAIVTGSGSGIGAAVARLLARSGARVTVADIDLQSARGVAETISGEGGLAEAARVDVGDEESCRDLVLQVASTWGAIDILVNNAGVGHVGSAVSTTAEDFRRVMSINVEGMAHLCRFVLPAMIERGSGAIVNIASVLGLTAMADRFAYTVSKHAVVGLTRSIAFDVARHGVRVNCVCPGRVETEFVRARLAEYEDPEVYHRHTAESHPIGRMAQPEEIAQAVLYLASDASSYASGSALVVDGGYLSGK
jgi:2-keto-3-deoxy-L-fuconate dehydrogenase